MSSSGGRQAQVSKLFPPSLLAGVIEEVSTTGFKSIGLLRYERTRVTGRPAFRQASMNEVNGSPVSPLPEYVSSCRSGNSSKGSSPSSNCRNQESSSTSPSSIPKVSTFLNGRRCLRHSVRPTSSCSSDDKVCSACTRAKRSSPPDQLLRIFSEHHSVNGDILVRDYSLIPPSFGASQESRRPRPVSERLNPSFP